MIRLVQLKGPGGRSLAVVQEPLLLLLEGCVSVYDLAQVCISEKRSLAAVVKSLQGKEQLPYDEVYAGTSEGQLLPAADHPEEPARCLVSGTGLTHVASAKNRQAMHGKPEDLTDSMRMYRWGVEGGKPAPGEIGVAPEWFYKGNGTSLRAHNEALTVPGFAEDGGEEPEIAGVYLIDDAGVPRRIGFTQGNEFSDHEFERRNYLYLAASKLRTCAIGPELVIGAGFDDVPGTVSIERGGSRLWSRSIRTGEETMSHSVANLEHHHFKFEAHRRPGDLHIHYFGADAFSFGEGIRLQDGDIMEVHFEGYGRALRNVVKRIREQPRPVQARPLEEA
ncbi:MAG: GguC family protein [Candidatus Sulfopaludibacter sp.]|nr:GguC family protein [Candidatus Sulfopaludibacter sp.]